MNLSNFQRYKSVLNERNAPVDRDSRLLMEESGELAIYYAPFDFVNSAARIMLVGITPGPTQMVNACRAARQALLSGADDLNALVQAKLTGAFSGEPMRSNLIKQMNHWGIHKWLGLETAAELFGPGATLLQTTSLLRYPVFCGGKPYQGRPDMLTNPALRRYLLDYFVRDFDAAPDALVVSLGPTVEHVLQALVDEGRVDGNRVALGMLHPSSQNTYRVSYLVGDRGTAAPHATNVDRYDRGRAAFQARHYQAD